jgi:hypothetical protein
MPKTRSMQAQRQPASTSKQLDARGYCYTIAYIKIIYTFDQAHEVIVRSVTDSDRFVPNAGCGRVDWRGVHVGDSQCGTVSE